MDRAQYVRKTQPVGDAIGAARSRSGRALCRTWRNQLPVAEHPRIPHGRSHDCNRIVGDRAHGLEAQDKAHTHRAPAAQAPCTAAGAGRRSVPVSAFRPFARWAIRRGRRIAARAENARVHAAFTPDEPQGETASTVLGTNGRPRADLTDRAFAMGTLASDPARIVTLERQEIVRQHSVTYGATGHGKSVLWLSVAAQELYRMMGRIARGLAPDTAIFIVEPKHDMAPQFLELLEQVLSSQPDWVAERVLANATTFNPLGRFVVPVPLLRPPAEVPPEIHAMALANLFGRLSGSAFGPKQQPITAAILLALDEAGLTLPAGMSIISDWSALRDLARRSRYPMVSECLPERAPSGLDGIRARLARVVFTPTLRSAFDARQGLDFDACLRPGQIFVCDLGGGIGDEDLTSFLCGYLLLQLSAAIRRRDIGAPSVIVIMDEFQQILRGDGNVGDMVATLLQTARGRGVFLHMLTQSPASVTDVSPQLLNAVHTNVAVEILGATDDARNLSHLLPVSGRRLRAAPLPWESPPASPWLTRDEELRLLVDETQALSPRHFWIRAKRRCIKATLIRTLDFRAAPSSNSKLRERLERGRLGRSLAELNRNGQGRDVPVRLRVIDPESTRARRRRPRGL
jgi:hypothetical protein